MMFENSTHACSAKPSEPRSSPNGSHSTDSPAGHQQFHSSETQPRRSPGRSMASNPSPAPASNQLTMPSPSCPSVSATPSSAGPPRLHLISPPIPPLPGRSAAVPFFAASSTEDDKPDEISEATDSIADGSSAAVARRFRDRYAHLPRLVRESRSPEDLLDSIQASLRNPEAFDPIVDSLAANALNAVT